MNTFRYIYLYVTYIVLIFYFFLQTISDIDFLILIPSAPENLDMRRRIRDTWASSSTIFHRRQIYFFIGLSTNSQIQSKIFKENGAFKDIIQPGKYVKK